MKPGISVLASGSSGNSIYISDGRTGILVDAGLSGKEIGRRLQKCGVQGEDVDAILVTHEHNDHIHGVGVLSRRFDIPIFANGPTWDGAASKLGKIAAGHTRVFSGDFMIGDLGIEPFSISHDANDPVGYIINCNKKRIGIATDMGYISGDVRQKIQGVDYLIIEANHDLEMLMSGPYPWSLKNRINSKQGHLSNDATAAALPDLINSHCPRILLGHLSQDNNVPDLAYMTIENILKEYDLIPGQDLELDFTYRDRPTRFFEID